MGLHRSTFNSILQGFFVRMSNFFKFYAKLSNFFANFSLSATGYNFKNFAILSPLGKSWQSPAVMDLNFTTQRQ